MKSVVTIPDLTLTVAGVPAERSALEEIYIAQELSLPAQCELTWFDRVEFKIGDSLTLQVGQETIFDGQITAIEYVYPATGGRKVRVRGYDLLHHLRRRQGPKTHVQVTLADLARELSGVLVNAHETGPTWGRIVQHRQSDLDLLIETAERCGLYFTLHGGELHVLSLKGFGDPIPLAMGDTLLEARVEVNGDGACRSVTALAWNPETAEPHSGEASAARLGREVTAEVPSDSAGSRVLVGETLPSNAAAEALAQGELDLRMGREVTLWGIAEGDPRLAPGIPVDVQGLEDSVNGRHVLTSVVHTIDVRRGYVSEISTSPPAPRRPRGSTDATLGVVTRVDDPDGLGRVQAKLPAYGDQETDWMPVVLPGKGLVILPDVGEQVVVLFLHGDPNSGLVLGGLCGSREDWGVEGASVKRYRVGTPGGRKVLLDDVRNVIRIEDGSGSYVELSPEKFRVHSAVDLTVEAPGRAVVLRGRTVDFEQA